MHPSCDFLQFIKNYFTWNLVPWRVHFWLVEYTYSVSFKHSHIFHKRGMSVKTTILTDNRDSQNRLLEAGELAKEAKSKVITYPQCPLIHRIEGRGKYSNCICTW